MEEIEKEVVLKDLAEKLQGLTKAEEKITLFGVIIFLQKNLFSPRAVALRSPRKNYFLFRALCSTVKILIFLTPD